MIEYGDSLKYRDELKTWILNEYRRAGRTDGIETVNDLFHGNATRFIRDFGVKPYGIEQLKIIVNGNLHSDIKLNYLNGFCMVWIQQLKKRNYDCITLIHKLKRW